MGNSILTELNHFFYAFFNFGLTSIVTLHSPFGRKAFFILTPPPKYAIINSERRWGYDKSRTYEKVYFVKRCSIVY